MNKAVKENAFKELEIKKESHSKVKHLKHFKLEMQNYLKPNKLKINQEDAQAIFKLRSRMTEVKENFKGKYFTHECELCNEEEETQEHIFTCKEILKNKKDDAKLPEYKKILEGNAKSQLEIANIFKENMKIRNEIIDKR